MLCWWASIGALVLFLAADATLDKLPLRKRDGARVVDKARNAYRVYYESAGVRYIKRSVSFHPVYMSIITWRVQRWRGRAAVQAEVQKVSRSICFFDLRFPPFLGCRCNLDIFYRHSNTDEGVHFIFPGSLVRSGEKPVTTMKAEPISEPRRKRSKVLFPLSPTNGGWCDYLLCVCLDNNDEAHGRRW